MNKEKKLIPELRFPEFLRNGEWRIQELNNNIDFQTGYPFKSSYFNEAGKGIRLVKNRDLKSNNSVVYYDGEFSEDYIINDGDILVGMDGDFTPRHWNKGKALLNQRVGRVLAKNKKTERFYEYFLTLQLYEIEKNTARTTVKHLSHSVIQKIKAPLPEPEEQQKIASCLSSLDELIAAHNDKLEALKNHKKSLMQNLFPQKDETVPKYRFPEFKENGKWVEKTLDELGDLVNGLTYSPKDVTDEGLLVLRSSNIQNGVIDYNDCVHVRPDIKGSTLTQPKDILVCIRNGSKRLIGKNAIIPEDIPLATHGAFMSVFRAQHPEFVFQLFQSYSYHRQVKADLGATINSINGKNFIKYEFSVPENSKEQQKIASCLSAVDDLITTQTEKIEQLQQHKKGLMQGLFPKFES